MATIPVGNTPSMVTFTLDGTKAYVCNQNDNTVSVIDVASSTVIDLITVDFGPVWMATNPVSGIIYVLWGGGIDYIDPSTDTVINSLSTLVSPYCFSITDDGTTAWVADLAQVEEVDLASATVTNTITLAYGGAFIEGCAISPDGSTFYALDSSGNLYVFDTATLTLTATHSLASGGGGLAISPDGSTLWFTDFSTNVWYADTATYTPTAIAPPGASFTRSIFIDPAGAYVYACDIGINALFTIDTAAKSVVNTQSQPDEPDEGAATAAIVYITSQGSNLVMTAEAGSPGDEVHVTTMVLVGDPGPSGYEVYFGGPIDVTVDCCVVTGWPPGGFAYKLVPIAPSPVPGPIGNHEYEVLVCDKYGVGYGIIPTAVPTEIDWVLDDLGQALIDIPIQDPLFPSLLPFDCIPGVREIQIWRDNVLIWWGWPVSATWDSVQVHLTCQGLLFPIGEREVGPEILHYVTNPSFEQGLEGWTSSADLVSATPETNTVVLGSGAARLVCNTPGLNSYLYQEVTIDLTDSAGGIAFALSAYVYLDGNYVFNGPALHQYGLFIKNNNTGLWSSVTIPIGFPQNQWVRLEIQPTSDDGSAVAFTASAGIVNTYELRLYCPAGSVVWDNVVWKAYENVSASPSSPPATSWDVWQLIQALWTAVQDPVYGNSDLAYQIYGANTGKQLNRVYWTAQSEVFLDALNEFPSIGICDFEMVWDAQGHARGLEVFSPAKGSIKYNYPLNVDVQTTTDLEGQVDGTQVLTQQRMLGQGSTGPSRDVGYAQFASYLGGRVTHDATFTVGDNVVSSATADFTDDDVGVNIYSLNGALYPSTYIIEVLSSTEARFNNQAQLTFAADETLGIGGIMLVSSKSALPDQPVSTLFGAARAWLLQSMEAMQLPAAKVRADGPNGYFGMIEVGDVVPVSSAYGWLTTPPELERISQITLYPPTEEMAVTTMPVNAGVSLSS